MTFIDGSITMRETGCKCDSPDPLPNGMPRVFCEFPCWQRVGLTSSPCCPDCSPLPEAEF